MNNEKIILGTAQFGLNYGINNLAGKPSSSEVNEILLKAHENGLRCLDTAEAYGNAHELIGDFHRQYPLQRFDVISKLPHEIGDTFDAKLDLYLKDLYVESLSALLFHSFETYIKNRNAIKALYEFKASGKVKKVGVSIYTNEQLAIVINDPLIDQIQLPFNMFDNISLRGKLLQKAKDYGKIVHARSVFLQGLFFKELTDTTKPVVSLKSELIKLKEISNRYGISVQKMALNYCLQQHLIDKVLIGVDNLSHLNENLDNINNSLPSELMNEIDNICVKDIDLLNPALWN